MAAMEISDTFAASMPWQTYRATLRVSLCGVGQRILHLAINCSVMVVFVAVLTLN